MGKVSKALRVNLICGLLASGEGGLEIAKRALIKAYGQTDFESPILSFNQTNYYEKELGSSIKRQFISFARLKRLNDIASIKIITNRFEQKFARKIEGESTRARSVNIDPGYLDLAKVVLLSTKDYSHRIYIGKDIYAEITLFYQNRSYRCWPWTYPDYRTPEYIDIFNKIRNIYKVKIS